MVQILTYCHFSNCLYWHTSPHDCPRSILQLHFLINSKNPNKGASLEDLSTGWRWDDGQAVEQKHWKNKCLNEPYEPILRNRAAIFQSYSDKKIT